MESDCYRCHSPEFKGVFGLGGEGDPTGSCTTCHRAVLNDRYDRPGGTPFVLQPEGNDLAGGNFIHVSTKGDRYGHNVEGFVEICPDNIDAPGLTDRSLDFRSVRLTCAGKYGCHGDPSKVSPREAMDKAHHNYDPKKPRDGKTVATSYRFLLGITGVEMNEDGYKWESRVSSEKHNEYQGSANWNDPNNISYLCIRCHGNASNSHGSGHPASILLSAMGEFSKYVTYDPLVPVARINPAGIRNHAQVNASSGNEVVMCLSCHRAHGSPYPSILRFPYDQERMSSIACQKCHCDH